MAAPRPRPPAPRARPSTRASRRAKAVHTVPTGRLSVYRPWLDRLTFAGALAGIGVVIHLWMQARRGFAGGCSGFDPNAIVAPTASGCATFIGVSNTTWGLLFYGAVALLSFALVLRPEALQTLKRVRGAVLTVGALYALYLIFVLFSGRAGGFCALCFISHVITLSLFAFFLADLLRPTEAPIPHNPPD
jgi:uncharacterized membrane protein